MFVSVSHHKKSCIDFESWYVRQYPVSSGEYAVNVMKKIRALNMRPCLYFSSLALLFIRESMLIPTSCSQFTKFGEKKLFHKIYVFRTFSNIVRWQFGRCCWAIFTWISRFSYLHMIIWWLWNMFEYIKLYALTHTVLPHIYILRKPRKSKRSLLGIITSNVNYNFFLYVYILFLDSFLPFFLSNFWNSSMVF